MGLQLKNKLLGGRKMSKQRRKRREKIDTRMYSLPIDSEEYFLLEEETRKKLEAYKKSKNVIHPSSLM